MAGMLPGVECARRRRLPGSGGGSCDSPSAVASAFGSARTRITHLPPSFFLQRRMVNQLEEDDKLDGAAREAKERLDGRLRGHFNKHITRQKDQERLKGVGGRRAMVENIQMEGIGLRKSGLKRFGWGRMGLSWRSISDEEECAICLDGLKASEKVTHLRCAHRFHSDCLLPWLETNTLCPCCRASVMCSN